MTRLSVNINKVALLRNSRGRNLPNLVQVARDCEAFGAEGITIHPRPDERHIRYNDIPTLKEIVTTELNIEGYPSPKFIEWVVKYKPEQCTLVPDSPDQLTSDTGWDTIRHKSFLTDIVQQLHENNIRVALFADPIERMIEGAKTVGADRIELYTGPYAWEYNTDRAVAVAPHRKSAQFAAELGLGVNAGHDLNLENLAYFKQEVPNLLEVSIGHALFCDAIYYGLRNVVQMYLGRLRG